MSFFCTSQCHNHKIDSGSQLAAFSAQHVATVPLRHTCSANALTFLLLLHRTLESTDCHELCANAVQCVLASPPQRLQFAIGSVRIDLPRAIDVRLFEATHYRAADVGNAVFLFGTFVSKRNDQRRKLFAYLKFVDNHLENAHVSADADTNIAWMANIPTRAPQESPLNFFDWLVEVATQRGWLQICKDVRAPLARL